MINLIQTRWSMSTKILPLVQVRIISGCRCTLDKPHARGALSAKLLFGGASGTSSPGFRNAQQDGIPILNRGKSRLHFLNENYTRM